MNFNLGFSELGIAKPTKRKHRKSFMHNIL